MGDYANFPASNFMTDFEIIVLQDEYIRRRERERLLETQRIRQEEFLRQQAIDIIEDNQNQNTCRLQRIRDDSMIRNEIESIVQKEVIGKILANKNTIETVSNSENEKENYEEKDNDKHKDENFDANLSSFKSPNTTTTSSTNSSDSMHSASNISLSVQEDLDEEKKKKDYQDYLASFKLHRRVHNNDTLFMEIMNILQSKAGEFQTVLSSIRPTHTCATLQETAHNDYFICHICNRYPKVITHWEGGNNPFPWKYGVNEHPFARNVGASIKHLWDNHTKVKGTRHITLKMERLLKSVQKDMEDPKKRPTFFKRLSMPKSASTSCLEAAWKSNQTDLTKDMVNTYTFDREDCIGHSKIIRTQGLAYIHDWADSVYCSCKTKIIDYDEKKDYQAPMLILDPNLSLSSAPSFFNIYKKSIHHLHRTIKCPFKIHMDQTRKIHHCSFPPEGPKTRSMTIKDNLQEQNDQANQQQGVDQTHEPSGGQNAEGGQGQVAAAQALGAAGPILEVGAPVQGAVAQIQADTTNGQPHEKGKGGVRTPNPRVERSRGLTARNLAASAVGLLDVRLSGPLSEMKF